jgi:hypothetical protein
MVLNLDFYLVQPQDLYYINKQFGEFTWNPNVLHISDSRVDVIYYTFTKYGGNTITKYTHTFELPNYHQTIVSEVVFKSFGGYVM